MSDDVCAISLESLGLHRWVAIGLTLRSVDRDAERRAVVIQYNPNLNGAVVEARLSARANEARARRLIVNRRKARASRKRRPRPRVRPRFA